MTPTTSRRTSGEASRPGGAVPLWRHLRALADGTGRSPVPQHLCRYLPTISFHIRVAASGSGSDEPPRWRPPRPRGRRAWRLRVPIGDLSGGDDREGADTGRHRRTVRVTDPLLEVSDLAAASDDGGVGFEVSACTGRKTRIWIPIDVQGMIGVACDVATTNHMGRRRHHSDVGFGSFPPRRPQASSASPWPASP